MSPPIKHCLLVVDDEPDICNSVQSLLRLDFRVLKAHSAAEAVRAMQENDVHIVMTDQRMPQVTGVEMLSTARECYPHAVRMLFTGYLDLESLMTAINDARIFRFIKKPWLPDELEAAMREAAAEYDRAIEKEALIARLSTEVSLLRGQGGGGEQ